MKINYDKVLLLVALLFLGCSKNDDDGGTQSKTVESYEPAAIEFVHEDGSRIQLDECITPDEAYAIEITATKNDEGNTQVSKIEYTINGSLYSMSFSEAGTKRNPITLVDGKNIAQLSATAETDEVFYTSQGDFELVD